MNIESGELEMKAYGGSLFDSDLHPKLEKWKFNNKSLLNTIKQLVRVQDGKNRSFVNYASIEVRHIGTVYEKLLEFHPEKENGKIVIFNKKGKKESEGTYYTPKYIVDNIVENALGPIVDKIIKENCMTVNCFLALSIEIRKGRGLVKGSNPIIDLIIIKKCEFLPTNRIYKLV